MKVTHDAVKPPILIVSDDRVQAGEPTFAGTRVTVRPVALALERGVDRAVLKADYGLTDAQLDAALVWSARAA